ncbi:MAG: glycerophosphodiester phosphodiesterase, partial [Alcaligenes sp.]
EYDVKLSRDGVPVLLHDDELDRTSNSQGVASALTLAELSALDFGAWHSSAYAGEPIPTLSSIAAFTLANQIHSNIEIKPTTGDEAETGRVVALAAQALWAQASLPPLLSSFSEVALQAAQQAVPTLPRALLIEEKVPADWPERLERLGCMGLNLNDRFVDQALVQAIRQAGYTVAVWTVNDAERVRELLDWGCNGIFTDKVTTIRPDTL